MLSAIKRIEIEAQKTPGAISLAQGVPSFGSDTYIRKRVIQALKENKVDKYSHGSGLLELRSAIAKDLQKEGMKYDVETEIIVTVGAMEALATTILSLVDPGDEVIVFTPTYFGNYRDIIEMAGGVVVQIPLFEKQDWSLPFNLLEENATSKTKIIILCNPNNPTGSIIAKEDLYRIGEIAKRNNIILVFDDVYQNLCYEEDVFCLAKEQAFRDQIIRIVSLSKDFALTGWRIGFMHGPEALIDKARVVHDSLVNCAPVISQYAALAAIQERERIVSANRKEYAKRRELMGYLLSEMKEHLSFAFPKGTYYFFPRIFDITDVERFAFDLLAKEKLAVVPGSEFGQGGDGHIRLCFGRSSADIIEGMRRLKQYLVFQN